MNVEFEEKNDRLLIRLFGELDHHNMLNERNRIEMKISTTSLSEINFDLTGLSFMDSSGISLIYNAYKIAKEFGQSVNVICGNERFAKILSLGGMKKFVKIIMGRSERVGNSK